MSPPTLPIGPPELEAIARLVAYASRQENVYRPYDKSSPMTEDDSRYVVQLGDFRVMHSLVIASSGTTFRHVLVSVQSPELLPNIAAVEQIVVYFGFVGGLQNCEIIAHLAEHCISVRQPIDQSVREQLN